MVGAMPTKPRMHRRYTDDGWLEVSIPIAEARPGLIGLIAQWPSEHPRASNFLRTTLEPAATLGTIPSIASAIQELIGDHYWPELDDDVLVFIGRFVVGVPLITATITHVAILGELRGAHSRFSAHFPLLTPVAIWEELRSLEVP